MAVEPQNAAAQERRPMSPEALQLVEHVNTKYGEVMSAVTEAKRVFGEDSAKLKLLANPEFQASLQSIVNLEGALQKLTERKDGEGSIFDRLGEAEAFIQRMTQGGGNGADGQPKFDPRAEAYALFASDLATNPILRDEIAKDPRLTDEYTRAMASYFRNGEVINAESKKALGRGFHFMNTVGTMKADQRQQYLASEALNTLSTEFMPGAGIFVTPTMETRVLRKAVEGSGLAELAGQKTTTSNRHEFTVETGHLPGTTNTGERAVRGTDDPEVTFWEKRHIDINEKTVVIQLTRSQVEDSSTDVVAEVENLSAKSMRKAMGPECLRGTGVNEGQGLFSDSRIRIIKTGTASTMPLFRLTQAHVDLLPEYLPNARYLLGIGALMSAILDTDGVGRPLWSPSLPDGTASLYNGFRWVRDAYLDRELAVTDSDVTFATGAKPAAFGDFAQAFWIVNRKGTTVVRDEVTAPGFIKYLWYRRWGCGVALPDAVRIIQVGT